MGEVPKDREIVLVWFPMKDGAGERCELGGFVDGVWRLVAGGWTCPRPPTCWVRISDAKAAPTMRAALERIAAQDYRGESPNLIARSALEAQP